MTRKRLSLGRALAGLVSRIDHPHDDGYLSAHLRGEDPFDAEPLDSYLPRHDPYGLDADIDAPRIEDWPIVPTRDAQPLRGDQLAQGLAEYALILALVAIIAIVALVFLGSQLSDALTSVGNNL